MQAKPAESDIRVPLDPFGVASKVLSDEQLPDVQLIPACVRMSVYVNVCLYVRVCVRACTDNVTCAHAADVSPFEMLELSWSLSFEIAI